jgi:hypothetical protein
MKEKLGGILALAISLFTAMVGHTGHHSVFWAIMDFIFWPIAWIKWLCLHQVTAATVRQTFSWFFN